MESTTLFRSIIITFGISASFVLFYFSYYKKTIKRNWHRVGNLSEIIIYPLKAGSGLLLEEAYCTEEGLIEHKNHQNFILGDRYFIAYDERSGLRISCKDSSIITKIKISSVDDTSVAVSAPGYETLNLIVPVHKLKKVDCMIYQDIPSETIDCGDEAARWMSNVIFKRNSGVRLGFYIRNKINRRSDTAGMLKDYKTLYPEMKSHYLGAYSFLASYLLINQSSLDDLNTRLPPGDGPVTSLNFRTNLTVTGEKAYEEDNWRWIKIGETVILKNFKPCTRCLVVTLNPETAQFNSNNEPLKTLKKYRLQKDNKKNQVEGWSPVFGQYFGLTEGGHIKIGDPVYVSND